MSQEIYVKEMPKIYYDSRTGNESIETKGHFIVKSLHDHDKELVAKVLDKIKMLAKDNFDFDMCNECGEFVHNDNVLTESDFNKVLNQIQKEFDYEKRN